MPRRPFVLALLALLAVLVIGLAANQLLGNEMGERCTDSYSCRGFLLSGVECVEVDGRGYCTIYCDGDADCPEGWSCEGANPTVLTVETSAIDEVCMRREREPDATPRVSE